MIWLNHKEFNEKNGPAFGPIGAVLREDGVVEIAILSTLCGYEHYDLSVEEIEFLYNVSIGKISAL